MRTLVLAVLCVSSFSVGKDRDWKDAIFLGMSSSQSGAAAMPVGTSVIAFPLGVRLYWFECEGIRYGLKTSYTGHWPNLTVNGHTKFALDGHNAHVFDEDNKDRKFSIVEKIAVTKQAGTDSSPQSVK